MKECTLRRSWADARWTPAYCSRSPSSKTGTVQSSRRSAYRTNARSLSRVARSVCSITLTQPAVRLISPCLPA